MPDTLTLTPPDSLLFNGEVITLNAELTSAANITAGTTIAFVVDAYGTDGTIPDSEHYLAQVDPQAANPATLAGGSTTETASLQVAIRGPNTLSAETKATASNGVESPPVKYRIKPSYLPVFDVFSDALPLGDANTDPSGPNYHVTFQVLDDAHQPVETHILAQFSIGTTPDTPLHGKINKLRIFDSTPTLITPNYSDATGNLRAWMVSDEHGTFDFYICASGQQVVGKLFVDVAGEVSDFGELIIADLTAEDAALPSPYVPTVSGGHLVLQSEQTSVDVKVSRPHLLSVGDTFVLFLNGESVSRMEMSSLDALNANFPGGFRTNMAFPVNKLLPQPQLNVLKYIVISDGNVRVSRREEFQSPPVDGGIGVHPLPGSGTSNMAAPTFPAAADLGEIDPDMIRKDQVLRVSLDWNNPNNPLASSGVSGARVGDDIKAYIYLNGYVPGSNTPKSAVQTQTIKLTQADITAKSCVIAFTHAQVSNYAISTDGKKGIIEAQCANMRTNALSLASAPIPFVTRIAGSQ